MSEAQTDSWPEAPTEGWLDTAFTLQMWSQIVGKVRLARAPRENHWWHIALYLTSRGLTTSPIPDGNRTFQIDFDFCDHRLLLMTSDSRRDAMPLASRPLPDFYAELMARLAKLGIAVAIWPVPVEVIEAVPFTEDRRAYEYRPDVANRIWQILSIADMTLKGFRGDFLGKASPVHFFWGSFDLAYTRFSGRTAPEHPGGVPNLADWVTREAYSHEVWSCGFWPGTKGMYERPAFYAYAYPEPAGYPSAEIKAPGTYHSTLREFLLPYDDVRTMSDPAAAAADFLRDTYRAAADRGGWPLEALERMA
jgi:hypothetical protein